MLSVSVDISEIDGIRDKLDKLGRKLFTFDRAMASIGSELVSYYSGPAYDSQGGAFEGGRWAPLNLHYALYKAKHLGTPIMVGPGPSHMRDSFIYKSDSNSVRVSNTKDYFVYHQSTEEPRNRLPRRQMIGMNETIKGLINQIITKDIRDKIDSV